MDGMANEQIEKIKRRRKIRAKLMDNAIYIVLASLIIIITAIDPTFLSFKNFKFIFTQASTRMILALGVAGIIVLAGCDLAIGRFVGLSAVISASMMQVLDNPNIVFPGLDIPVIVPVLLVTLICGLISLVNGLVVTKLSVTAFIATLGMQMILYGLTSTYYEQVCGASPVGSLKDSFTNFAQGEVLGIPYLIIYATIIAVLMWFIWTKTKLGRHLFAIGNNEEAAKVSGVNIHKTILIIYLIAGFLYGFAGALEVGRTGSATNNLGNGYELDAIAACVVGGVSLLGGVGNILGIVIGVIIFQVINYGLVYISVSPYMLYIIKGAIVILAVAVDAQKYVKRQ
ncbi:MULTISPECIES: galactose/methyl galactoside ABC transporter permease MglC [Sediminispirochaeta]|uniref:Inner-membrane translocator n=1 Tax=Sediminispirochaeta smaragdinae (strain DSM 11293 / JCM 15392 / SEBR 4228) TaxID=573413 RepID=E1R2T3_SEDSS|nr:MULTISPECIES: galactose/methyl galactoside ABC transporter permease MglC [Sediminispirochaeta]ADK80365.1 inner-membrane translocator [Sediminispirochaeta smaragdinae DSM 11293]